MLRPSLPALSTGLLRTLAVGWTLAIVVGLSIPGENLPTPAFASVDKLAHLGAFAGWGLLWLLAYPRATTRIVVAGLLFAVLSETYQHVMPIGRTFSLYDALADAVGLLLGLWVGALWRRSDGSA